MQRVVTVLQRPLVATFVVGLAATLLVSAPPTTARADDFDKYDGAVWRFQLTPKTRGLQPLRGTYRINNHVIFQKSKPRSDYDVQVGKNFPNRRKTRVQIDNFRAFGKNRSLHTGIKGTARLSMDERGEWSGRFVDSDGRHWDMTVSRIQE